MQQHKLPGSKFQQNEVEVRGYRLLYASAGDGPVIVSLPGSAGFELSFGKDLLAERFTVVELNPPGWGPRDDVSGKLDQRDLADILAEAIDKLGFGAVHLLGTSMGGVNALWMALNHASMVKSLVLDAAMAFMEPAYLRDPAGAAFIKGLSDGTIPPEVARQVLESLPPGPRYEAKPFMDQAYFLGLMTKRMRMFPHFTNDHEATLNARAKDVACPALVLVGTEDEILKPEIRRAYEAYMPQARFHLVSGGSHDLQGSHPELFARVVADFVSKAEAQ
jgi:pimeloyl-ACP methyl ester carboxylesterase